MTIIEFPKVKVDIPEIPNYGYHNPQFFDIVFSEERALLSGALALTLAAGLQNAKKLLGATIDEYILAAVQFRSPELGQLEGLEWQALQVFVQQFASREWVYGIIPRGSLFRGKYVLQTPQEIVDYFQADGRKYDKYNLKKNQAVNTLFFVPSRRFTQHIFGFDYAINGLEKRAEFKAERD